MTPITIVAVPRDTSSSGDWPQVVTRVVIIGDSSSMRGVEWSCLHLGFSGLTPAGVESLVNLAWLFYTEAREATLDLLQLRRLIQSKLADGRLPLDSIPQFWGGIGNVETCHACDETIAKNQFVMEALGVGKNVFHFHVSCFSIWDDLRRTSGA